MQWIKMENPQKLEQNPEVIRNMREQDEKKDLVY